MSNKRKIILLTSIFSIVSLAMPYISLNAGMLHKVAYGFETDAVFNLLFIISILIVISKSEIDSSKTQFWVLLVIYGIVSWTFIDMLSRVNTKSDNSETIIVNVSYGIGVFVNGISIFVGVLSLLFYQNEKGISSFKFNSSNKDKMKKVKELMALGDLEQSKILLDEVLKNEPENGIVHYNLACVHSLLDNKEIAILHLKHAIKLGFTKFEIIVNDKDLANVREHPDFKSIF